MRQRDDSSRRWAIAAPAAGRRPAWPGVFAALGFVVLLGCRSVPPAEVEVEVRNVALDRDRGSPVVILAARESGRVLPIWIGPAEAQAIAMELQKVRPSRPLTHDLIKSILEGTRVTLRRVRITGVEQQTYLASLVLEQAGREIEIDARPSDAIALALRFTCPILVRRALLEGAAAFDLGGGQPAAAERVWDMTVQDLDPAVAELLDYAGVEGVLIADVEQSGAQDEGPRRGDLIVAVDGAPVASVAALRARAVAGGPVRRLDLRRGAARLTVRYEPSARAGGRG